MGIELPFSKDVLEHIRAGLRTLYKLSLIGVQTLLYWYRYHGLVATTINFRFYSICGVSHVACPIQSPNVPQWSQLLRLLDGY